MCGIAIEIAILRTVSLLRWSTTDPDLFSLFGCRIGLLSLTILHIPIFRCVDHISDEISFDRAIEQAQLCYSGRLVQHSAPLGCILITIVLGLSGHSCHFAFQAIVQCGERRLFLMLIGLTARLG